MKIMNKESDFFNSRFLAICVNLLPQNLSSWSKDPTEEIETLIRQKSVSEQDRLMIDIDKLRLMRISKRIVNLGETLCLEEVFSEVRFSQDGLTEAARHSIKHYLHVQTNDLFNSVLTNPDFALSIDIYRKRLFGFDPAQGLKIEINYHQNNTLEFAGYPEKEFFVLISGKSIYAAPSSSENFIYLRETDKENEKEIKENGDADFFNRVQTTIYSLIGVNLAWRVNRLGGIFVDEAMKHLSRD